MKIFSGICLLILITVGCEDMMTEKIEIDSADFPPRLAVSATLDTDSGRFTMTVYEGWSLISYNRNRNSQSIIRNGTVNLYQDDQLVWTLTGYFDLSPYKYPNYGSEEAYRYINAKDIPAKAGSAYKLEVDMDGYEKVHSTVVMPADPIVSDASMDIDNPVEKNKVNHVTGYGSYGQGRYCPVKCTLVDNAAGQDYYALQVECTRISNNPMYPYNERASEGGVGVSNLVLLQDNPDWEAEGSFLGDGESYDLYLFSTLLISDITFPGSSATLDLFTSQPDGWNVYPERLSDYNPAKDGVEVVLNTRIDLKVKHITAETFKHYRSLALQEQGMGFFTEPVKITSNVENGYGCFSLQNTRRVVLQEYKRYWYPDRYQYTY